MRRAISIAILAATLLSVAAQSAQEKDVIATVQRTFDGINSRDEALMLSTVLPGARFYSARDGAAPAGLTAVEAIARIAASKVALLERFTAAPKVMIRGNMAQVWGEYEFLRDGKFSHCGVDTVTLYRTAEGWKIASLAYTVETSGCPGR